MWKVLIVTPWIGSGIGDDVHRAKLSVDHPLPSGMECSGSDVTGQPAAGLIPNPNLFVVLVTATPEYIAEIEADANYLVLSAEEIPDATI